MRKKKSGKGARQKSKSDAWRGDDKTGDFVDSIHVCNLRMTIKGEANYGQPSHERNVQYGVGVDDTP